MMARYWQYCPKCGTCVKIETGEKKAEYTRELRERLDILMEEHQLHLCNSCTEHFAECKGTPVFGNCVGNDNVVECDGYSES